MIPRLLPLLALLPVLTTGLRGEAMLQYFNTDWNEITGKMPELAEAGYGALWLPPPTKGSGGLSVGYDCWDRFDLGSKDQRGSVRTRYGTEAELLELVRVAHRFGIRVYFDNVMNHNAFDTPRYNEAVPAEVYPGFVPEDFHLRTIPGGFFRKWDNVRDYGDEWQVQNLGLSDLIDIATEPGEVNRNHGANEGDTATKPDFVRHPQHPEYYCYVPGGPGQKHHLGEGQYVGFGPGNGITVASIAADPGFYSERVEHLLNRAARWQLDRTKCDGFRLDAVKHTPADFFGATFGADKDASNYGYSGQIQEQFNLSRGFADWGNHRDSVFDTERPRDDAMLFGEHLGQPPAYGPYIDAGMRLIDNDLRNQLNQRLGNPSEGLQGFDQPGWGGFPPGVAVMHAQSHDNSFAARRELQHAMYFTRAGLGLIYTDGNYHAGVLGGSGGEFPRIANTNFLGQFGDPRVPNLLKIHADFARGEQKGRWSDADRVAYERIDRTENGGLSDADATTMLVAINDNYAAGRSIEGGTSFPSQGGAGSEDNPDSADAYLFQYARGYGSQVGFYTYASALGSVIIDPGSYMVFAPRTPEPSVLWRSGGERGVISIAEGGAEVGTIEVERRDGPDGDPGYNPYGLPDADPTDFSYRIAVPRVTDLSDLSFTVRTDGSAANVLFKLDGGVDLNGGGADALNRDHPPGTATDVYLGYEQPAFVERQFAEKFAAAAKDRSTTGSPGAETYATTVGSGSFATVEGPDDANDLGTDGGEVASFLLHDPLATVGGEPDGGWPGGTPPSQYGESPGGIGLWARPNAVGGGFRMFCYYTVDGSNPEGAGGAGDGSTQVVELNFSHNQDGDDWWGGSLPPQAPGTGLKYKIGIFREGASPVYPSGPQSVDRKKRMMTTFAVQGFDGSGVVHAPHNDHGETETGLAEGFHVLRARAFLQRDGKASLYRTYTQTFYVDASRPAGEVVFPAANGDPVGGASYGVVVRADRSTEEAWFRILDSDPANDDAVLGIGNGNGAWVAAVEVTPSPGIAPSDPASVREFRFDYVNIPSDGSATIEVRLRERSSSDDDELDDADGHFTTLSRLVTTAGPEVRLFIPYPGTDGQAVGSDYVFKAHFSKSLADGLDEAGLLERFSVRHGPEDQWPGATLGLEASALSIEWDATADHHALAFSLPVLARVDDEVDQRVEVFHDRPAGLPDLTADRRVQPVPEGANGPDDDLDGDGVSNRDEWLFGMNPYAADASELPRVTSSSSAAGWTLAFPTLTNRIYQYQVTGDLVTWHDIGPRLDTFGMDDPGPFVIDTPLPGPRSFYRIVVAAP